MARLPGVPCTVTRSEEFRQQAEAIESDYQRLDEMLIGAEWTVARTEHRGFVEMTLNPGQGRPKLYVRAVVHDDGAVLTSIEVAWF